MRKIAIVGTGIAGMAIAHFLKDYADIMIFEKNDYIGGHTHTVTVHDEGDDVSLDTGFMVYNEVTYPLLTKLFKDLSVDTVPTNMSFGVQYLNAGIEYSGTSLNTLFAQRKNLFSKSYLNFLWAIYRFNQNALNVLKDEKYQDWTIEDYFHEQKFPKEFLDWYLVPMASAVWSCPKSKILNFPVKTLVRFYHNHGFLGMTTHHTWRTVLGGSRKYRDLLIAPFQDRIFKNESIVSVKREVKVLVKTSLGRELFFDDVILASHADQSLSMLQQPTETQKKILGAFKYQKNMAFVHTDTSVMPQNKRAWASWNYRVVQKGDRWISNTIYDMVSLQNVSRKKRYFVSIEGLGEGQGQHAGWVDPRKILWEMDYEHPIFDLDAIKAQESLHLLNKEGPIYFCGSYFRYGFHEDALWSAHHLAQQLIREWS